ncbi:hypothetical protein DKM44_11395 [Deinococcus irradiatisoli]|uniref:YCII-related domain-containing protein n=1 Tax=Deinococcus irradiatisoli TaxID=2202254 RepID=A0A2Z3JQS0_9DEIO|nr:YciI family protein [Deinococcus irradiatisoli]AWN23758.1 hypothetical protein DKM44_11395 [Deinococcus irradiatisoli]
MTQPPNPPLHVIIGTYTGTPEEVSQATPQHREWLDQHYRSGLFLASGRQSPPVGGVLLARGESAAHLEEVMRDDPFTKLGLATYQIIAFTPVKRHASFPYLQIPATE